MKKLPLFVYTFFVVTLASYGQTVVGYWDLNNTLARSDGSSGILDAEVVGFPFSTFIDYGTGTSVNLPIGFTAGQSLRFFDLTSIVEIGHVTISGLNFTGLTSPTFSFAVRGNALFQIGDSFELEYNTGSGWVTAVSPSINTTYSVASYSFSPGLLDGLSNVDMRIAFSTVATVIDVLEVDNILITAVPEPASVILLGIGIFVFFLKRRNFFRSLYRVQNFL